MTGGMYPSPHPDDEPRRWWRKRGKRRVDKRIITSEQRIRQLVDSRRTIVEAYEVERQRIERDLHDGAQQYFVAAAMALGEAELKDSVQQDAELAEHLAACHEHLEAGLRALRRVVRGIHPQTLHDRGLVSAVEELLETTALHATLSCPHPLPALPEGVTASAYFFVSEAVTNATKYAPDADIDVLITVSDHLRVSVFDTGPGGATFITGGGLAGMRERLAAVGGTLSITSPPGGPTQIIASLPLLLHTGESAVVIEGDIS